MTGSRNKCGILRFGGAQGQNDKDVGLEEGGRARDTPPFQRSALEGWGTRLFCECSRRVIGTG